MKGRCYGLPPYPPAKCQVWSFAWGHGVIPLAGGNGLVRDHSRFICAASPVSMPNVKVDPMPGTQAGTRSMISPPQPSASRLMCYAAHHHHHCACAHNEGDLGWCQSAAGLCACGLSGFKGCCGWCSRQGWGCTCTCKRCARGAGSSVSLREGFGQRQMGDR